MKRIAAALRRRDLVRLGFEAAKLVASGTAQRIARGSMLDEAGRRPSTLGLIGDAVSQASRLFSSEIVLAKTELGEKMTSAVAAVASIVGAGVFLVVAMIFLLQALVSWLVETGWRASVASLLVGVVIMAIALIALLVAKSRLTVAGLAPSRSIAQASKMVDTVRGGRS